MYEHHTCSLSRFILICSFCLLFAACATSYNKVDEPTNTDSATTSEQSVQGAVNVEPSKQAQRLVLNEVYQDYLTVDYRQIDRDNERFRNPDLFKDHRYQIFKNYGVNPTVLANTNPVSTFAMDVDTASYNLASQMLMRGELPDTSAIRVEEFVNAMSYQYQDNDGVFALSAEAAPSPFREGYHVLHLGVQSKTLSDDERKPANLVLVADVSGSMSSDRKLELLKEAFITLCAQLTKHDRVAIVAYSNQARTILQPTAGHKKRKIYAAIRKLKTWGGTNAERGISMAYDLAEKMYEPGLINRVVLTSDGMANAGATTPNGILRRIQAQKNKGIFLTTVGVGVGTYNDFLLEQLANKGNGHYLHIANTAEIQSVFVDKLTTQLQVVAKNAKVQVEFNPEAISHYRLLGYENRELEEKDFLDADKDGGELGAGHRVTAIYEVKLKNGAKFDDLGELRIAYQKPEGRKIHTLKKILPRSIIRSSFSNASSDTKLSITVAAFAEKLRQSYWSNLYDYEDLLDSLSHLPNSYMCSDQLKNLRELIRSANRLDDRQSRYDLDDRLGKLNLDHVPLLN